MGLDHCRHSCGVTHCTRIWIWTLEMRGEVKHALVFTPQGPRAPVRGWRVLLGQHRPVPGSVSLLSCVLPHWGSLQLSVRHYPAGFLSPHPVPSPASCSPSPSLSYPSNSKLSVIQCFRLRHAPSLGPLQLFLCPR